MGAHPFDSLCPVTQPNPDPPPGGCGVKATHATFFDSHPSQHTKNPVAPEVHSSVAPVQGLGARRVATAATPRSTQPTQGGKECTTHKCCMLGSICQKETSSGVADCASANKSTNCAVQGGVWLLWAPQDSTHQHHPHPALIAAQKWCALHPTSRAACRCKDACLLAAGNQGALITDPTRTRLLLLSL